jgi:predicted dehydrogenase
MKHLIQKGFIGNIQRVLWSWGTLRRNVYFERYPWKGNWKTSGGGLLSFWFCHDLDTIRWLIGKPVQVSAFLGNQLHSIETEDILSANIVFENGAVATIQATLNQPGAFHVRQIAGDRGMVIVQDCKSLTFDHGDTLLVGTYKEPLQSLISASSNLLEEAEIQWNVIDIEKGNHPTGPLPFGIEDLFSNGASAHDHGLFVLFDSFIHSIVNGGDPLVTGEEALQTQELMNAITFSALKRKTIDLPLSPIEFDQVFEELINGRIQIPRFHD